MRKQITLYDDQYAFYKELKSEKLLIAFIEYMFEDIEPTWFNSLEQTIRNSLVVRMDNLKKKSEAWTIWWKKSHWWWRPKNKQTTSEQQTENKQKTNKKQTEKQAKNNQVKVEDKDKVEDIENNKLSISNDIDNSKAEYWNKEINEFIDELKEECNRLWVAYEKKDERNFAKHILTAKDYWDFAEKIWQSRVEFAKNVLFVSWKIWFFKWICAWPKAIYQNYAEVYNEAMKTKSKAKTIPKF